MTTALSLKMLHIKRTLDANRQVRFNVGKIHSKSALQSPSKYSKRTYFYFGINSPKRNIAYSEQAVIAHACHGHTLQLSTGLSCLGQKVSS